MFNVLNVTTGELVLPMSTADEETARRWKEYCENEFPNMEFDLMDECPGYPCLFPTVKKFADDDRTPANVITQRANT